MCACVYLCAHVSPSPFVLFIYYVFAYASSDWILHIFLGDVNLVKFRRHLKLSKALLLCLCYILCTTVVYRCSLTSDDYLSIGLDQLDGFRVKVMVEVMDCTHMCTLLTML